MFYGYNFEDVEWQIVQYWEAGFHPHVYIHNMDFDLRKIPSVFRKGNVLWNTTKKINNKYVRLDCEKYTFHDSIKLLPMSLAKLSYDFNVEHGKLDLWEAVQETYPGEYEDHVDFLIRCDQDDDLYLRYLGYDVISLYEVLQKLMAIAKLETKQFVRILTTASLSRYLFKNGYGGEVFKDPGSTKTDYEILTYNKSWASTKKMKNSNITYLECENKIREGFYGGRTEVFKPICAGGYHYDVNSLYPSQCLDNYYPVGYPEYLCGFDECNLLWHKWLRNRQGLGFIKADVYVPPQNIPPLPSKIGKLAFLTGYITGTWTYVELLYAVEKCGVEIQHIHEMIHFKRVYKVFHNYVGCFYKLKEKASIEGNDSLRAFAKLILNVAYGWTVLNRYDKTACKDISLYEKWFDKDPECILYSNEDLGMFEIEDFVRSDSVQAQVGAYVTSYARLVLLDALRNQEKEGEVYYCDTDSLVCDTPLPDSMVHSSKIGLWDLEGVVDSAIFLQPKVYTECVNGKDHIKFKGVTKSRQNSLGRSDYEEILHLLQSKRRGKLIIEEGRTSLPSLSVAQKNHLDPNVLNEIDKSIILGNKQKRDIDYAGNTSRPWHMGSLDEFVRFSFSRINPPDGPELIA